MQCKSNWRGRGAVAACTAATLALATLVAPAAARAEEYAGDEVYADVEAGYESDFESDYEAQGDVFVGEGLVFALDESAEFGLEPEANAPSVVVAGTLDQNEAKKLLDLVNGERSGLTALSWDAGLEKAAIQRAAEISLYLNESRPDGSNASTLAPAGVGTFGQNISSGSTSASAVNTSLKGSASSLATMKGADFTQMGAACFTAADGRTYWVELFSNKASGQSCGLNGSHEATVIVRDGIGLTISATNVPDGSLALKAGETKAVEVEARCDGSAGATRLKPGSLAWGSDDEEVATAHSGLVTAIAPYSCNVIATPLNGDFSTLEIPVSVSADISGAYVSAIPDQAYTGKAIKPKPTVTFGGRTLKLNTDYTLSYDNNVARGTASVVITGKDGFTGTTTANFNIVGVGVSYTTHVQGIGWQPYVSDGLMAGTEGQSKRLEGIRIKLEKDGALSGSIEYRTHVQREGWKSYSADDAMSGTEGQSKRLEAIQIRLTGEVADYYDVWYRVHAQTFGWMGWAKNDEQAGTAGYSKRLEGIEIQVLPKGSEAPGSTDQPFRQSMLQYRTHVQTYGWQPYAKDGEMSGTEGQSKRLEAIEIQLLNCPGSSIEYRTHRQTYGWEKEFKKDGATSGTFGESKRLEGIEIRLAGPIAADHDVWYRVHAQTFGWMGWAKNGEQAGTEGGSKRLEAIEILVLPKDAPAPGTTANAFRKIG